MDEARSLIVVADDFGIGPATSKAILKLATLGSITAGTFLVTSPHAASALQDWRKAGQPMELGWQPCLTLDAPVLPPQEVPSLVNREGRFFTLAGLVSRATQGRLRRHEIFAELKAQQLRFQEMLGHPPSMVAPYQHIQLIPLVGAVMLDLLSDAEPKPYFRRVREAMVQWIAVRGARLKRLILSTLGRRFRLKQERAGFPGNDYLAGLTDPRGTKSPQLMKWWLSWTPGRVVELCCRPGFYDGTLIQRVERSAILPRCFRCLGAGFPMEERLGQRMKERELLESEEFQSACQDAGFVLKSPSQLGQDRSYASLAA